MEAEKQNIIDSVISSLVPEMSAVKERKEREEADLDILKTE